MFPHHGEGQAGYPAYGTGGGGGGGGGGPSRQMSHHPQAAHLGPQEYYQYQQYGQQRYHPQAQPARQRENYRNYPADPAHANEYGYPASPPYFEEYSRGSKNYQKNQPHQPQEHETGAGTAASKKKVSNKVVLTSTPNASLTAAAAAGASAAPTATSPGANLYWSATVRRRNDIVKRGRRSHFIYLANGIRSVFGAN